MQSTQNHITLCPSPATVFGILAMDCNNTVKADIKAYALVLNLVENMFPKITHKYELNDFSSHNSA